MWDFSVLKCTRCAIVGRVKKWFNQHARCNSENHKYKFHISQEKESSGWDGVNTKTNYFAIKYKHSGKFVHVNESRLGLCLESGKPKWTKPFISEHPQIIRPPAVVSVVLYGRGVSCFVRPWRQLFCTAVVSVVLYGRGVSCFVRPWCQLFCTAVVSVVLHGRGVSCFVRP
jgi:intracellular sulfur oxidation DsrE/DsrF family protein